MGCRKRITRPKMFKKTWVSVFKNQIGIQMKFFGLRHREFLEVDLAPNQVMGACVYGYHLARYSILCIKAHSFSIASDSSASQHP